MIHLEPLASQPGDCWAALRRAAEETSEGGEITVRYGRGDDLRLRTSDVRNLLLLAGFVPGQVRYTPEGRIMTARRQAREEHPASVTVVVPCRNEVDNVAPLIRRVPRMGTHTEILFVDGNSTDGTPERIKQLIGENPDLDIKLLRQQGARGKATAVFQGFDAAEGDIVMILDADMTVAPEDLPRFYLALTEGLTDFANGTRFAYPMEQDAMPGLNTAGNRVFGLFLSWVLSSRISDSLCGTKAMYRRDWQRIRDVRPLFGGHDPWGDFDLLMGAAYCGLRIMDVPVPYHARTAGESKMRPLAHGWVLGLTCLAGIRRLKLPHTPAPQSGTPVR